MDRFGEGVFSMLAQMKKKKLEEGETIVDLSIARRILHQHLIF